MEVGVHESIVLQATTKEAKIFLIFFIFKKVFQFFLLFHCLENVTCSPASLITSPRDSVVRDCGGSGWFWVGTPPGSGVTAGGGARASD